MGLEHNCNASGFGGLDVCEALEEAEGTRLEECDAFEVLEQGQGEPVEELGVF